MHGIQLLLTPFVWILMLFYNIFNNYGVALLFFALLVKLILFPFQLKGKRSMIQMNMLSEKMQKLQKQYGKDKERYNLEVQKLYEKEKVNPMSGCLWTMLPLLVLLPLYAIVRQPLTYLMNLSADQITTLLGVLPQTISQTGDAYFQLNAADVLARSFDTVVKNPAVAEFAGQLKAINFDLLGINLASVPQWKFWVGGMSWSSIGLFLLPVISAITGFFFSLVSMKTNAVNQQSAQAANNPSSKMMMFLSPLMSLWIGFIMPAGLSIYWLGQNIFSIFQEFISGKMLKKDYEKAAEARARREAEEKEEEKRRKEEARLERAKRLEEAKNTKGKKKPAPAKKKDDEGIPASVKEASRVGLRAYARGRAYDPYRFSQEGPTPYQDAAAPQTRENSQEREFKRETELIEEAALEQAADDMIVEQLMEENAAAQASIEDGEDAGSGEESFETPTYEKPGYDAPDYEEDEEKEDR